MLYSTLNWDIILQKYKVIIISFLTNSCLNVYLLTIFHTSTGSSSGANEMLNIEIETWTMANVLVKVWGRSPEIMQPVADIKYLKKVLLAVLENEVIPS